MPDDYFWRKPIYAIVRAGGRQFRVEPDQVLDVDRLAAEVGSMVELTDVLLLGDNGDVRVGTPTVEGARVQAEVVEHGRDKKLIVFKYKAKTRYRRKQGHRQGYTRLAIRRILTGHEEAPVEPPAVEAETKPKRPARRAAKPAAPAAEVEALAVETGAETVVEAKPRRPRRTAKAAVGPAQEPVAEVAEAKPALSKAEGPARRSRTKGAAEGEQPKPARRRSKKTESD